MREFSLLIFNAVIIHFQTSFGHIFYCLFFKLTVCPLSYKALFISFHIEAFLQVYFKESLCVVAQVKSYEPENTLVFKKKF